MREPGIGKGEMTGGGSGVLMHLGALVLKAGVCQLPNILIDSWPYVPGCDQLLSSPNTGVGESVQNVKYLATELWGNQWARDTSRCVTQECGTAGRDWHL